MIHVKKSWFVSLLLFAGLPIAASAHAVVQPAQVGIGSTTLFTLSIPNERDTPTTSIRLVIPAGFTQVTPTINAAWQISVKTTGSTVSEIDWAGTGIPVGQRADLTFTAEAPAAAGAVDWKTYQTYGDGVVVAWDKAPSASEVSFNSGPYSVTSVVNDLGHTSPIATGGGLSGAYIIAGTALMLALISLYRKQNVIVSHGHDHDDTDHSCEGH